MKKYLIFFFAMLMATSSLVFTSCSSDNDDETVAGTNYSEMIVGSWTYRVTVNDEYYTDNYTRFYADGTYKEVNITVMYGIKDKVVSNGTWSISGNKITTRVSSGLSATSTITKMTSSEMGTNTGGLELKHTKVADSVFEQYYNQK